jgi:HD-GYP domain-containing protein (c-di-GMP phosphodiesterase class II)
MRFIPLDFLKDNTMLAENLVNIKNQILLRKNVVLNSKNISRIKALGFKSLYVKNPDEEDILEEEVKDIINPEIRKKAVFDIKDSMERFTEEINKQKQQLVYGNSGQELLEVIDHVSESLIDEILNSSDLKISIMDIKSENDYLYEHAVNTAVLSIMLAVKKGLNIKEIRNIAIASLLINVGYKYFSKDLYDHPGPLTDDAWREMRQHPVHGHEILTGNTTLNSHVRTIVLHHHERIDGSGYPGGLKNNDIHPHAKIVMLADVYDAMTSDRKHRSAFLHNEVIEYIMGNAGRLFDFELSNIFSRCIVPYPAGTHVLLSDGRKGIVLKNNNSHPLRPVIRIIKDNKLDESPEGHIDLMKTHNLTIEKIVYD